MPFEKKKNKSKSNKKQTKKVSSKKTPQVELDEDFTLSSEDENLKLNDVDQIEINQTSEQVSRFPTHEQKKPGEGFTARDYEFLAENENLRYYTNSKSGQVGHAVIIKNEQGEKVALQYAIPAEENGGAPKVVPLKNIEEIVRFGLTRYRAATLDNKIVYAKRYLRAKVGDGQKEEEIDIAYFSESEKYGKEPFWGNNDKPLVYNLDINTEKKSNEAEKNQTLPLFRNNLSKKSKEELKKEIEEIGVKIKGGEKLVIDHESVRVRDKNKKRTPTQNKVMDNESAKDTYAAFFEEMTKELSPEMNEILKRAINAPLMNAFYSNYRPEWLHGEGFSLTPIDKDPQRKDNLGAAPKWANTQMMVLERIVKWFALNRPNSYLTLKPHFEMLLNSELIKHIHFEVTVKEKEKWMQFIQDINPFKKWPVFSKASDVAQGTAITYNILNNVAPISEQKITKAAGQQHQQQSAPTLTLVSSSHPLVSGAQQQIKISDNNNSSSPKPMGTFFAPNVSASKKPTEKSLFPTHFEYEKSVVQISTTLFEPDYDEPTNGSRTKSCSGTGFVVENDGRKYILTNAHVVENAILLRVRDANCTEKFEAKVKCVSYQCDLALLEVEDPKFQTIAQPVQLGEMIRLKDKVQTIGFPMGGNEISISKGIVSRIEVRDYCMSGLDMLQVQIDAAVNPGNSGGPVFSDGKVVGTAFQGYDRQGLGFMIPIPIIKHFLTEAFSNKPYRGFPILPIRFQTLVNPTQRKFYGMTEKQTGIRIKKIDNLCDAFSKLKEGDILLELDGHPVSNDGTVDIPGIGNRIDMVHLTHMKFVDDTVSLKILRNNPVTKKSEIHTVQVILDHVPLETEIVPQNEHDKMPTYYINSGISFIPVTRNYLEGDGAELEDMYFIDEGCSIPDMPKKSADEQLIVINNVLDCKETEGYDEYIHAIIKEINGKPIKNIHDVVSAMENNKNDMHEIVTARKNVIVVENMHKDKQHKLLKQYNIRQDRSDDLLSSNLDNDNIITIQKHVTKPKPKPTPKSKKISQTMEQESDEKSEEKSNRNKLTINDLPGHRQYLNKLDELEDRYKDFPEEEDEIVDSDYEDEYFGEEKDQIEFSDDDKDQSLSSSDEQVNSSKEEIEAFLESSSEEETPLVRRSGRLKSGNIHSIFYKPNKHDDLNNKKRKKPDFNNNDISDEEIPWNNKKRKFK